MEFALLTMMVAGAVAYANGANDVSKGVATLVGSHLVSYRQALLWGTLWTVAGCLVALVVSAGLVRTFSTALVQDSIAQAPRFPFAVAVGAFGCVMLASRTGLPALRIRCAASGLHSGTSIPWDPNWCIQAGDFDGDRDDDLFLYNESTGVWVEALVDAAGAFTYHSGAWDPGWRVALAPFTTDGRAGLLLYASASGTWVRAIPSGPGTFTYVSGTFGAGVSLVTTTPRNW